MQSKDKTKFRTTPEWKNFREQLLEDRGQYCELCGGYYPGKQRRKLQVHHLDPQSYDDLNPEKFALLCSSDHDLVERLSRKILSKRCTLTNLDAWAGLLIDFLPLKAKHKLEMLISEEKQSREI